MTWAIADRNHTAHVDPFELLYVDPTSIRLLQQKSKETQSYPFYISEVRSGDWDKQVTSYRECDMYRSFNRHFNEGVPWIKTEWAQRIMQEIEDGWEMDRGYCSTPEEFLDRCGEIDQLYERIASNGYKTQRELMQTHNKDALSRRWSYFCPELHEVTVNITREGEFIFQDGWRRFTIANVLGLNKIPVRVNLRHHYWQAYRNSVARENGLDPGMDHPDIRNVISHRDS